MIEAKALRTYITVYFPFKCESFNGEIKCTLHKALIGSGIICATVFLGMFGKYQSFDVAVSAASCSPHNSQLSGAYAGK
jgi:hypothetical protein